MYSEFHSGQDSDLQYKSRMRGSDLQLAGRWMSRGLQVNTELTHNISTQCEEPNVSIQVDTTQNEDRTNTKIHIVSE